MLPKTQGRPSITIPVEKGPKGQKEKAGLPGLPVRLHKNPNKPPLPSIFFARGGSLVNKMDELEDTDAQAR